MNAIVDKQCLWQWFLTLLKVLNPANSIYAFTEPFLIRGINQFFEN